MIAIAAIRCLALGLAAGLVASKPSFAAEPDELWVIIHRDNPSKSLDADALHAIFTARRKFWADRTPIVPLNAPSESSLRVRFDQVVLGMTPEEVGRFWVNQRIRGRTRPPRKVGIPTVTVKVVLRLSGGIAYVPAGTCLRGTKVVAVIADDGVVPAPASIEEGKRCVPHV